MSSAFWGNHPRSISCCLDIVLLFNSFYVAVWLEHFSDYISRTEKYHYIALHLIPVLISMLVVFPPLLRKYSLCSSVASIDHQVLWEVLSYMEEEENMLAPPAPATETTLSHAPTRGTGIL